MKALIIITLIIALGALAVGLGSCIQNRNMRTQMHDAAGMMKDMGIDVGLIK